MQLLGIDVLSERVCANAAVHIGFLHERVRAAHAHT